jgi:hypothetical protein
MGMYGVVPTIYVPNKLTDQLVVPFYACKRTIQMREMIERTPEYATYQSEKQALFDRLTTLTGTVQKLSNIATLADTLKVEASLRNKKSPFVESI